MTGLRLRGCIIRIRGARVVYLEPLFSGVPEFNDINARPWEPLEVRSQGKALISSLLLFVVVASAARSPP